MRSRLYFRLREKVRMNPLVSRALYTAQNAFATITGRLRDLHADAAQASGVALCLRFRDEAPFLDEWLTYHRAAGVEHFFLYNNFSQDAYGEALRRHIDCGLVTLVDWPHTPASPAAEEDCVRRAAGHFEWLGFLDADEFLVIHDGRSIGDFLAEFRAAPAVALHWIMFGSNGHKQRPDSWVTRAYTRRQPHPNLHVKCFIRPDMVTQNRNSHCWYYRGLRTAVDEHGHPVYGSISVPGSAEQAWINHYYCKSEEDYLQKAQRRSTLDRVGIKFPSRRADNLAKAMNESNEVYDDCAVAYYAARSAGWLSSPDRAAT